MQYHLIWIKNNNLFIRFNSFCISLTLFNQISIQILFHDIYIISDKFYLFFLQFNFNFPRKYLINYQY